MTNRTVKLIWCVFAVGGLVLTGCAEKAPVPDSVMLPAEASRQAVSSSPPPDRETSTNQSRSASVPQSPPRPVPRQLASLQLSKHGRKLLHQGRIDEAISVFERAVGLSPVDGESYYYLAEAWMMKGEYSQAMEFNRLAALYLNPHSQWMKRVDIQRAQILDKK